MLLRMQSIGQKCCPKYSRFLLLSACLVPVLRILPVPPDSELLFLAKGDKPLVDFLPYSKLPIAS